MEISLIYVLIAGEVLLLLLGASITLTIMLLRKPKAAEIIIEETTEQAENELDTLELSNNYIEFLEQEMQRNATKTEQLETIEEELTETGEDDHLDAESVIMDDSEAPSSNDTPEDGTKQSKILKIREQFLLLEKEAAEKTEDENIFWSSIYDGMNYILEEFSTTQEPTQIINEPDEAEKQNKDKDKVMYIETQGKKIDGEVNKLKDIIYEQENALSSMKKALTDAEGELPEESAALTALREQMESIERQLNDSKMCMDVLEMENNRLQEEVDKIEIMDNSSEDAQEDKAEESESLIDLDQMKGVVEEQADKIQQLIDTIESLEIEASQAEKLKETLSDFTRTSQEMMSCITILEEENERLVKESNEHQEPDEEKEETSTDDESAPSNDADVDALKSTISNLEEEVIKKDVAYAQLQDEFSSMETEYLSMYEAMHNSDG